MASRRKVRAVDVKASATGVSKLSIKCEPYKPEVLSIDEPMSLVTRDACGLVSGGRVGMFECDIFLPEV